MKKQTRSRPRPFTTVWEFRVPLRKRRAFEKAYGPNGAWTKLFYSSDGYIRTDLLRDRETPGRYLTIDHWKSGQAFFKFKQDKRVEYEALDEKCAALTEQQAQLGEFEIRESN